MLSAESKVWSSSAEKQCVYKFWELGSIDEDRAMVSIRCKWRKFMAGHTASFWLTASESSGSPAPSHCDHCHWGKTEGCERAAFQQWKFILIVLWLIRNPGCCSGRLSASWTDMCVHLPFYFDLYKETVVTSLLDFASLRERSQFSIAHTHRSRRQLEGREDAWESEVVS